MATPFRVQAHVPQKGIYIDGHEREDVVKYRSKYLKVINAYQQNHQPRPLCSDERPPTPSSAESPADTSTSALSATSPSPSSAASNPPLRYFQRQRVQASFTYVHVVNFYQEHTIYHCAGIMVGDFIEEHSGWLLAPVTR